MLRIKELVEYKPINYGLRWKNIPVENMDRESILGMLYFMSDDLRSERDHHRECMSMVFARWRA